MPTYPHRFKVGQVILFPVDEVERPGVITELAGGHEPEPAFEYGYMVNEGWQANNPTGIRWVPEAEAKSHVTRSPKYQFLVEFIVKNDELTRDSSDNEIIQILTDFIEGGTEADLPWVVAVKTTPVIPQIMTED